MISEQSASIQLNKIAPPSLPELPLIGILPFLSEHLHLELHQLAEKYGNIFQLPVGERTLVVISGLETIQEALVNKQDIFSVRADFEVFNQGPQTKLLELKSGDSWKKHRKIIAQSMRSFVTGKSDLLETWLMEEAADLVNIFLDADGQVFDPDLPLFIASSNFLHNIAFGEKDGTADFIALNDFLQKLPNGLLNVIKLDILPEVCKPMYEFYRQKKLQDFYSGIDELIAYVSQAVEKHRKSYNPENLENLTDALLKASSELTESEQSQLQLGDADIVNGTLIQFLGAGTELPCLMVRWTLLYMMTYPDIQAKVQKELDEVVGKNQQVSLRHRSELPFTEACINEVFRHAAATVMPPITNGCTSDTTLAGYSISKNTPLLVNYYSLTRDERYWEKPEQFNPYRFLDENGELRKKLLDKFYPFGMGSRRCIGEYLGRIQINAFLLNLLHQCTFERVPGEELCLEPQPGAFTSPKHFTVLVKRRF